MTEDQIKQAVQAYIRENWSHLDIVESTLDLTIMEDSGMILVTGTGCANDKQVLFSITIDQTTEQITEAYIADVISSNPEMAEPE